MPIKNLFKTTKPYQNLLKPIKNQLIYWGSGKDRDEHRDQGWNRDKEQNQHQFQEQGQDSDRTTGSEVSPRNKGKCLIGF